VGSSVCGGGTPWTRRPLLQALGTDTQIPPPACIVFLTFLGSQNESFLGQDNLLTRVQYLCTGVSRERSIQEQECPRVEVPYDRNPSRELGFPRTGVSKDSSVQGQECPRTAVSKDSSVQGQECPRTGVSKGRIVQGQECPRTGVSKDKSVQVQECLRIGMSKDRIIY
jgi:hypothetical protein